jgi:hypothetical protein
MKKAVLLIFVFLLSGCSFQTRDVNDLRLFLENDETNELAYDSNGFNCFDYSMRLYTNLKKDNWESGIVVAEIKRDGHISEHVYVWVQTSNGFVFVEPQNDGFYSHPFVGQELCNEYGCISGVVWDYSIVIPAYRMQ